MATEIQQAAPGNAATPVSVRDRLVVAGRSLFSEKGYDGASVREICARAGTSLNMIRHYFGSKRALYDQILAGFSESVFSVPIRIISEPPRNRENLRARLEIFFAETLEALIAHREVFEMVIREKIVTEPFLKYNEHLITFFEAAIKAGLVRKELDSAMLTGVFFDRLTGQIAYAGWIEKYEGQNILTPGAYRDRWLRANMDLICNGILDGPRTAS